MSKALHFLQITAEHQDYPFFTVFLTTKSLSQNISITLLQISLKLPVSVVIMSSPVEAASGGDVRPMTEESQEGDLEASKG